MKLHILAPLQLAKALWPRRVRTQLILGVALVHVVLMSVFVFDLIARQREFLQEQSLEHVIVFARTLATNSKAFVRSGNIAGLAEMLGKEQHYHIVRGIMVLDAKCRILAHTDKSLVGKYPQDDSIVTLVRAEPVVQVLRADSRDVDVAAPILSDSGKCLGWARIIHDREYVEKSLSRISRNGAVYILFAILLGALFAIFIGNRLTAGIERILAFTARVEAGRHDLRLAIPPGYEVGQLSEGFNRMLDAIEARGKDNLELRHILDNLSEGCMIVGFDWTYCYVNTAAARQRHRSGEDLLGHGLLEIFPEAENSRIFSAYRRCMEERIRMHFESEHTFKAGHPRWYELSIEPVEEGIFVLSLDISERKKAERELAESEKKYRRLIETLNEGVWVIDAQTRTTFVNPRMAAMLGYTVEEMQGKELFDFMDERGRQLALQNIERRKHGVGEQHDFEFIKKDGTRIYTIIETTPFLTEAGEYNGALAAVADITDRRKLQRDLELAHTLNIRTEELRQANIKLREMDRLKSMFIASMSHELRTPLNSIIGFSSILLKEWCGPVNAEQKENLGTVLAAGKHLHLLINEVIDVSKIEAGKLESIVTDFDIHDLLQEALAMIESELGHNGIKFNAALVHRAFHTDRRRLLQCVINLLSNAAKFTLKGEVSVRVEIIQARDSDPAADLAEITVTDTGIGIKAEDIPRLFFPFTRLTSPLTEKTKGTGLGLYLVKKMTTEILKGDIVVKSVYGQGSAFSLRIPAHIEEVE